MKKIIKKYLNGKMKRGMKKRRTQIQKIFIGCL
jgi:hypothetical protein